MTNRDVQDDQLQIVLPPISTSSSMNQEATMNRTDSASTSGNNKKQKAKVSSKKAHQTQAEIIEKNIQRQLDKSIQDEYNRIARINNLLKEIPSDDYSKAIDIINASLTTIKTSQNRLPLLKSKFHFQKKYLKSLRKETKTNLTDEDELKLDLLEIDYIATMTEMAQLEKTVDVFNEKKKYLEELINVSPLDREQLYRFQLEKINSRLPRRKQDIPDPRVPDFIPDSWQVKFLDAVDKRQSIIIIAPTASGVFNTFLVSFSFINQYN